MALSAKDRAWSILLRELPQLLARPTERQAHDRDTWCSYYRVWFQSDDADARGYILVEQARDLLALVLAQKPRTLDATASHKDAKILLLRMALANRGPEFGV